MREITLLDDRDGSTAWAEWLPEAWLQQAAHQGSLTIPSPNVRVHAVLNGQGMAINDRLVEPEIDTGMRRRLSEVEMHDYGYHLAILTEAISNPDAGALIDWLKSSSAVGKRQASTE